MPPATRENPRCVTPEEIEAFEKAVPALAGIGRHMVVSGIWVLPSLGWPCATDSTICGELGAGCNGSEENRRTCRAMGTQQALSNRG